MFGVCVAVLVACGKGNATPSASPASVSGAISASSASAASATGASMTATATAVTYSAHGVSFNYPQGWQSLNITSSSASTNGTVVWQEAFGPGPGSNFVSVTDYSLSASVTADNIDQQEPQTTNSITSLFQQAGGSLTSGPDKTTMGGLPALGYAGTAVDPDGNKVSIRMVLAYDGATEYYVNCQGSQAGESAIAAACDQIVGSFSLTPA
jgi:hypothetical protein